MPEVPVVRIRKKEAMNPGDVIRLTHFMHYEPELQAHYKAPKGKVFLAVLLGVENKDGTEPANPIEFLNQLGWKLKEETAV